MPCGAARIEPQARLSTGAWIGGRTGGYKWGITCGPPRKALGRRWGHAPRYPHASTAYHQAIHRPCGQSRGTFGVFSTLYPHVIPRLSPRASPRWGTLAGRGRGALKSADTRASQHARWCTLGETPPLPPHWVYRHIHQRMGSAGMLFMPGRHARSDPRPLWRPRGRNV